MKGHVLDYSVQTNQGIISGEDGNRYVFTGAQWKDSRVPVRGMYCDFVAAKDGSEAQEVYIAAGSIGTSVSSSTFGAKSKIAAGVLAILLGVFGVHKFYLGYSREGAIMLAIFVVGFLLSFVLIGIPMILGVSAVALIEGILYLTKSDEEFERVYVADKKAWF